MIQMPTRPITILLVTMMLAPVASTAQVDSTRRDSTVRWYDTLTVTKARYAQKSRMEHVALAALAALALPVGMIVGGVSILPPSVIVRNDDGVYHGGVAINTGIGFGGDSTEMIYFPDIRVQGEFAYYFNTTPGPRLALSVLGDYRFMPLDRRGLYWLALAGGAGVSTDLESYSPFVEATIGAQNPLGIRFVGLYPMHTYGIRGRVGYDLVNDREWFEIALSLSTTFGW